jgi:hypothetical protein
MRGKRTAASHRERDVDFYLFTSVFVWTHWIQGNIKSAEILKQYLGIAKVPVPNYY